MPAGTFDGNNMLMKDEMKPQSIARLCRRHWYAKKLHIVIIFWLFKALTTTYCVICMSSVESCLCRKVPRGFLRVKPLLWVEKTTEYRWFCTFWIAKNWKKSRRGVRHKCGSYSSAKANCPAWGWNAASSSIKCRKHGRRKGQNKGRLRLLCPERALLWMRW